MGRFDERATQPGRGPRDMLRWKLGRKRDPRPEVKQRAEQSLQVVQSLKTAATSVSVKN